MIAGVSIGAITAVLLARPVRALGPLGALEAFWKKVTVPGYLFPPPLRPYASFFGNPNFFTLRPDFLTWPLTGLSWTYFYNTQALRATLTELVDLDTLKQPNADPLLLVSATNVKEGQIKYFDSRNGELSLDHIMASGSLPPAFPMTTIGTEFIGTEVCSTTRPSRPSYDRLDPAADVKRTIYVVNLFPNKGPIPDNMLGVAERMKNLQFANKTLEDLKLLCQFNEVAELMEALETLPEAHPLRQHQAYQAVKTRGYVRIPRIVSITPPEPAPEFGDADFTPETMKTRETQGHAEALKALEATPQDLSLMKCR